MRARIDRRKANQVAFATTVAFIATMAMRIYVIVVVWAKLPNLNRMTALLEYLNSTPNTVLLGYMSILFALISATLMIASELLSSHYS